MIKFYGDYAILVLKRITINVPINSTPKITAQLEIGTEGGNGGTARVIPYNSANEPVPTTVG